VCSTGLCAALVWLAWQERDRRASAAHNADDPIMGPGRGAGPCMTGGRPMVALSAPVSSLDAEMARLGCKDSTMVWYRSYWRRLQRYFAARGAGEFSLAVAMERVDPDPGQARPGGSRPGERGTPPRHALAAVHAGDPPFTAGIDSTVIALWLAGFDA
jgi:hypothetical protein